MQIVGSLATRLTVDDGVLVSGLGRAGGRLQAFERQSNTTLGRMDARFTALGKTVTALGTTLIGVFAGSQMLRGAATLIDTSTRIQNSLKVAGLAGAELDAVYDELYASAQRNAVPLENLAQLYSRVSLVQKELGASTQEMLKFTDNVAVALRVAGTDAQSASGALLQLSQAMGSGIVRAEEFNSILEGALPIAQAAAAGLDEAGGSVAKLRQLVVDGKVSSEAFFRAFEAGSVTLQDKVAGAEMTVSQAFVRLQNVLIDSAGRFNETSQAGQKFAGFLDVLGQKIQDLVQSERFDNALMDLGDAMAESFARDARDIERVIALVDGLREKFDRFGQSVADSDLALGQAEQAIVNLALNTRGQFGEVDAAFQDLLQQLLMGRGTAESAADAIAALGEANPEFAGLQSKIATVIQHFVALRDAAVAAHNAAANTTTDLGTAPSWGEFNSEFGAPTPVKTVSLADYPITPGSSSGGRGGGTSDAEKQRKAVDDLVQSLADERAAIGMSATEQRVMNELRRVGISETDAQGAAIAQMIRTVESETDAFDKMQDALETSIGLAQGFASTLVQGFREGKDASEVLKSAVGDLLVKLGEMTLNNAIAGLFGGFGGGQGVAAQPRRSGLLGGFIIPGILHEGGRAGADGYRHSRAMPAETWAGAPRFHSGLGNKEFAAILQRGERVLTSDQSTRTDNLLTAIGNSSASVGDVGKSVLEVVLSDDLRARVIQEAVGQSVQISRGMVEPVSRAVDQMAQQQRYS